MSLESLNLDLFSILNVPEQASPLMMHFATFVAHDLVYLLITCFALFWFYGHQNSKALILKAFIFCCVALSISEVASYLFNTPRPFVMHVGQTLIAHEATGSFPSNHMTIFSSIAFAYYFSARRDIGRFLLAVAWLVAWSRIYVGVHFPVDMAGAFILSWAVNFTGLKLWNHYQTKLMCRVMFLYEKLFSALIERGLIK
ncbi:phosphatase PAP2 family protein [Acinetobacter sp.]|uniref:phosphatase PAP2 family protein n=1 Tax=Acinetobacter sp. TaxID=472 RepID=UPI003D093196